MGVSIGVETCQQHCTEPATALTGVGRRRQRKPPCDALRTTCLGSHQRSRNGRANPGTPAGNDGVLALEHIAPPRERRSLGRGSSGRHGFVCVC